MTDASNEQPTATKSSGMLYVKAYLVVYALLFITYICYKLTGGMALTPTEAMKKAFPTASQGDASALAADFKAPEGHLLLWEEVSYRIGNVDYVYPAHSRLNKQEAIRLALALQDPKVAGAVDKIVISKYGIGDHLWSYGMTLYNLGGLFLLIIVFTKQPLTQLLESQAKATAAALATARAARAEAEKLKEKHQLILAEVEEEKKRFAANAESEFKEERDHILEQAKHDAEGLMESMKITLDAEVVAARDRLRVEVAKEAFEQARVLLLKEAGETEHTQAVETFVKQLKKVDLA